MPLNPNKRINVKSFDMDGCIFNLNYEKSKRAKEDVIPNNRVFIDTIVQEFNDGGYKEWVTLLGSNRQSKSQDDTCSVVNEQLERKGTISGYEALEELNKEFQAQTQKSRLDEYLLSDTYGNKPAGENFKNARNNTPGYQFSEWFDDTTKSTILYAQMHKIATENPDAHIVFDFYDNDEDILKSLHKFYSDNKDLMPHTVKLRLNVYAGGDIKSVDPLNLPIVGEGRLDHEFEKNIKLMVANAFRTLDLPLDLNGRMGIAETLDAESFKLERHYSVNKHYTSALQILRTKNLPQENKTEQENLVSALECLSHDLKLESRQFSAVNNPVAAVVAAAAVKLMEALEKNPKDLDAVRQFETQCKQYNSLCKTILKGIAVVIFAAVGFILGAVIGGGLGFLAGLVTGPGAAVTGLAGSVKGSITGAALAVAAGSASAGFMFFKPAHTQVAEKARELVKVAQAYDAPVLAPGPAAAA